MKFVLPKCRGGVCVAIKANYYKVGVTCMISTAHYPYGGIMEIGRYEASDKHM